MRVLLTAFHTVRQPKAPPIKCPQAMAVSIALLQPRICAKRPLPNFFKSLRIPSKPSKHDLGGVRTAATMTSAQGC